MVIQFPYLHSSTTLRYIRADNQSKIPHKKMKNSPKKSMQQKLEDKINKLIIRIKRIKII